MILEPFLSEEGEKQKLKKIFFGNIIQNNESASTQLIGAHRISIVMITTFCHFKSEMFHVLLTFTHEILNFTSMTRQ